MKYDHAGFGGNHEDKFHLKCYLLIPYFFTTRDERPFPPAGSRSTRPANPWRLHLERARRRPPQGVVSSQQSCRLRARRVGERFGVIRRPSRHCGCERQTNGHRHQADHQSAGRPSVLVRTGIPREKDRQRPNLRPTPAHRRPPALAARNSGTGDQSPQRQSGRCDDQRPRASRGRPDHRSLPRRCQTAGDGRNRPRQDRGFALAHQSGWRPGWGNAIRVCTTLGQPGGGESRPDPPDRAAYSLHPISSQ